MSVFTVAACASSEVDPTDLFGTPTPDQSKDDAAAPRPDYGSNDASVDDKDAGGKDASKDASKDGKASDSSVTDGASKDGATDATPDTSTPIPTAVDCDIMGANAGLYYVAALLALAEPVPEECPCSAGQCCWAAVVCIDE